jgi:hypothetical protein
MKVADTVALFGGTLLLGALAAPMALWAASHVPGKERPNPGPGSEMSYDQGALWTPDDGPSYDLSRPEDEDPLAGLPIGTAGVAKGSQVTR